MHIITDTMWLALLLIAHVAGEWVEISQQHYRKPVRINYHTTETPEVYANSTVSPAIWIDNRKSSKLNTRNKPIEISINEDIRKGDISSNGFKHETTERYEVNKDFVGIVERVTNVGKVKRVQLTNTPVKSPGVDKNVNSPNKKNDFINHEFSTVSGEHRRVSFNDFKKQYISTTEENPFRNGMTRVPFKNYSLIRGDEENYFKSGHIKNINDNFNAYRGEPADVSNIKIDKIAHIEPVKKPNTKLILDATNTNDESIKEFNSAIPDVFASENKFIKNVNNKLNERNNDQYRKASQTIKSIPNDAFDQYEDAKIKHTSGPTEEIPTPKTKANTMEVLLKIMRTVADTISKNSHRSLNSKMKYLHQLKNTLLENIENRIDSIWPDDTDDQEGGRQGTRFTRDTARGHVEFPSSESALMTISFLTFAVFLIKLVLQVIQTYKNKTMMVAPLVVATAGRAALQRLRSNDKQNI